MLFFPCWCSLQFSLWKMVQCKNETPSLSSSFFLTGSKTLRVSSSVINWVFISQFLTFIPGTLLLTYECQEPTYQLQKYHNLRYQHWSKLPVLAYTQDSHREPTGLLELWAGVLVGKGVALTYSNFPSSIPKIILTSGCPALQRAALYLFCLNISRFVISRIYFLIPLLPFMPLFF